MTNGLVTNGRPGQAHWSLADAYVPIVAYHRSRY